MKNKSKTKKENPHKFTFEQIEDEAIECRYCNMFDWLHWRISVSVWTLWRKHSH